MIFPNASIQDEAAAALLAASATPQHHHIAEDDEELTNGDHSGGDVSRDLDVDENIKDPVEDRRTLAERSERLHDQLKVIIFNRLNHHAKYQFFFKINFSILCRHSNKIWHNQEMKPRKPLTIKSIVKMYVKVAISTKHYEKFVKEIQNVVSINSRICKKQT